MDEALTYKVMTVACMTLACLAGLGAIAVVVMLAIDFTWGGLLAVPVLGAGVGFGAYGSTYYGRRASGFTSVFSNAGEKEVLSWKQRQELRRARGSVVMERALTEIEHEHQNIVHNQIEASNDPDKPPHKTRWSPDGDLPKLTRGFNDGQTSRDARDRAERFP